MKKNYIGYVVRVPEINIFLKFPITSGEGTCDKPWVMGERYPKENTSYTWDYKKKEFQAEKN